jgi:uncharacterized protein YPO0396
MIEIPLMPGTTEGTIQWRAERLQVVNWGGFHGHHQVSFAPGSTLISGESGTGKSTLMDAYIALMMPHNVPFNGASNDATVGRARGEDQRNLVTYLRGKRDDARTGEDITDRVLRGDAEPTWGAVGMTFVDENGRRFTAFRAYHVPVGARTGSQLSIQRCTLDGDLELSELAELADSRFDTRALRARFPGLDRWDSDTKFIDVLCARLGIGAGGDGIKALGLLARIQAGYKVTSVDGLYKQMVLEAPRTFDLAAAAVEQFQSLDQSYRDLETDAEKQRILHPIRGLHEEYLKASEAVERLDRFGVGQAEDAPAPFLLWSLRTERTLLDQAAEDNHRERQQAQHAHTQARTTVTTLVRQVADLDEQQRANGGGALESLESRIGEAESTRDKVTRSVSAFEARTEVLGFRCETEQGFDEVAEAARGFVAGAEAAHRELVDERDTHVVALPRLIEQRQELRAEAQSLGQRAGQVPMDHHEARNQIAEACGLTAADLPFAAELMDVDPQFEPWREAAEATLRPVGLIMLMDAKDQDWIRQRIDRLHLNRRIAFDGVDLEAPAADPVDDRYISGRLVFKEDSPFVSWVKRRVTAGGVDHLCVDGPEQLGGSEAKVTINGQTSRGRRGAHGRTRGQNAVLGFDNRARLEQIAGEVAELDAGIQRNEQAKRDLDQRISEHGARIQAYEHVLATEWVNLDVDAAEQQVIALRAERQALLDDSDVLAELKRHHEQATTVLEAAREEEYRTKGLLRDAAAAHARIVDRQDKAGQVLDRIERSGAIRLGEEDGSWLDEAFVTAWPTADLPVFDRAVGMFRKRLADDLGAARAIADARADQLTQVFARFQDKWPDDNRGTSVESYPEYELIHRDILHHGLPERRQAFMREFQRWSGNDLKLLNDAYEHALTEIEDRLDPINEILADLPFGAQSDRLRINLRRLERKDVNTFRKQLRELSSNLTVDWTDEQMNERFRRLRALMDRLDPTVSGPAAADRARMLDVRQHIEITAGRIDADGAEVSTYSHLGGKSGGESQELVAFIVGAALRYQLGDDTRTKPRFAPVFLDEGFVKADGHFAGRALRAWRGLGFQLIVGAPNDKVTAMEPHMDLLLAVTKNQDTGYSYVTEFRDAEGAQLTAAELS